MKPFRCLVIIKHPLDLIWVTIRDRMPELASMLDDIESIAVIERHEDGDGTVRLVNEWRAKIKLPAALHSVIKPEHLGWTDRAVWDEAGRECRWSIEPFFLPEAMRCTGTTNYEPAIGGRGTRVTFAGNINVDTAKLGTIPATFGWPVAAAVELLVTTIIPRNFRKTTEALTQLLTPRRPG
jgi:hypothetical protein